MVKIKFEGQGSRSYRTTQNSFFRAYTFFPYPYMAYASHKQGFFWLVACIRTNFEPSQCEGHNGSRVTRTQDGMSGFFSSKIINLQT